MSATPFDYNGDGFSDVFWVNANTGQNLIWNMVNNQFNSQQVVAGITVPDNAISISGDFNGNGTTDVFQWNVNNGQANNLLFSNDQVATTVPLPTTLPASGWFPEISGDFNGDGRSDILWHNFTTTANVVWFFNSNGQFSSQTVLPSSTNNWTPLGSGDFNGNGTDDILWQNTANNTNEIWTMSGGQFVHQTTLPSTGGGGGWTFAGVGDFNADGTDDILWHNFFTNDNVAWQINNSSFVQQSTLPDTAGTWALPRVGNFDSDPTSEIFWHNLQGGGTVVWNLSNLNFVNQVTGPNATFPPWVDVHQTGFQV